MALDDAVPLASGVGKSVVETVGQKTGLTLKEDKGASQAMANVDISLTASSECESTVTMGLKPREETADTSPTASSVHDLRTSNKEHRTRSTNKQEKHTNKEEQSMNQTIKQSSNQTIKTIKTVRTVKKQSKSSQKAVKKQSKNSQKTVKKQSKNSQKQSKTVKNNQKQSKNN